MQIQDFKGGKTDSFFKMIISTHCQNFQHFLMYENLLNMLSCIIYYKES